MSGKVLICTGHRDSEGWRRISDLTLPTKEAYARKWGHTVLNTVGEEAWVRLCSEDDVRKWNHLSFARTRICQLEMEHLLEYDDRHDTKFILWIDTDAAVTRYDVDVCEYLNSVSPTAAFYCANDHNGINTGVMAFRVCASSLDLLARVWDADPKYDQGCWWEQGCLSEFSKEMGIDAYPDKAFFDAYPQEPIRWDCPDYDPGYSFIVHAPAKSDEERLAGLSWCIEKGGNP